MLAGLKSVLENRFQTWIKARVPLARETVLTQKRIYIVPSSAGLGLIVLFTVMILLGINFQNNLVFFVAFWLLALLTVNILYTYRNLSGLVIRAVGGDSCYAGQSAHFILEFENRSSRGRLSVQLGWPDTDWQQFDLKPDSQVRISLSYPASKRGWLVPPRLTLVTRFPTGLARAWAYILADTRAIIYPKPLLQPDWLRQTGSGEEGVEGLPVVPGSTDYSGIRDYQPGDRLNRIHWPAFARHQQLVTREFGDYPEDEQWLDWYKLAGGDTEAKLSHLTARAIDLDARQLVWGLRLPGVEIAPDRGDHHRIRCLSALALYGDGS